MLQPNPPPSLLSRLARAASLALLFTSACTIEHMEVGIDKDGLGTQPTSQEPSAGTECPGQCAIPDICRFCDDGSCARADVSCKADGSCGPIDWVCPGEPVDPGPPTCVDVCDAVCNGDPVPSIPDGCPTPQCQCEPTTACDCPIPEICRECADGSCAEGRATCNPDGTCGGIDWVCGGGAGVPGCPNPEFLCQVSCKGEVLDVPPDCPVSDCECEPEPSTCECAVPDVCWACDDDTCATPHVECNDGVCGDVLWTCEPGGTTPPCNCAIDLVCKLCPDGSCAVGVPQCNADGSCAEPEWVCASEPTLYNCDTSQVACDLAVTCEPGLVPTSNGACYGPCVKPELCASESYDCDLSSVVCKRVEPVCAPGFVPTAVGGCFGPCVPADVCEAPPQNVCPNECPVDDICHTCADGTCAEPKVTCNSDGSCGETMWTCPNEPTWDQ